MMFGFNEQQDETLEVIQKLVARFYHAQQLPL